MDFDSNKGGKRLLIQILVYSFYYYIYLEIEKFRIRVNGWGLFLPKLKSVRAKMKHFNG